MPDTHPGLAAEYEHARHPELWVVAHFDWFSEELTPYGAAPTEAEAEALKESLAVRYRSDVNNLVVLPPLAAG